MRLLFAGTPEVAVPALQALLDSSHDVVAVLTRPDARAGRGRRLVPSPVSDVARQAGLEVLTPNRPRDPEFLARLAEIAPDCAPIVAYGGLIPADALAVPTYGWVNLHFSLLPAWRGAAPVQRAIIAGDDITGASTFLLEEGLDTGPVFGTVTEAVHRDDTAGDLLHRLAITGAGLLKATLDGIEGHALAAVVQSSEGVSLAPKLSVDDARIDWVTPAMAIERRVRGCTPAPGAWSTFRGQRLKVAPVAMDSDVLDLAPGELRVDRNTVRVGTGTHAVVLGDVQPQGKKSMLAGDWARGVRPEPGERCG